MTGLLGSAGTAGDGYRVVPAEHDYQPEPPEYGRRPVCTRCHREHVTVPEQRRAAS